MLLGVVSELSIALPFLEQLPGAEPCCGQGSPGRFLPPHPASGTLLCSLLPAPLAPWDLALPGQHLALQMLPSLHLGKVTPAPCSGTPAAPRTPHSLHVVSFHQSQTPGVRGCLSTWPGERGDIHRELGGRSPPLWYWLEDGREGRKRRKRRGAPTPKVQRYFKHPLFPISV